MSSKTDIVNLALVRLGEKRIVNVDTDGGVLANEVNAIWTPVLEQSLSIGPEKGWRFARHRITSVDVDSTAITAFADYSGTVTGTVSADAATHGLLTGDLVTISDSSYDSDYTITKIDADTFYFTATFTATSTGTVQWTSQEFLYRFPRPTSIRVTSARVGGIELTDWEREGSFILTNLEDTAVDMTYIKAVADLNVTDFPPHFIDVQWRKLAIQMAYSRVQKQSLANDLITEIERIYLPRAQGIDNREVFVKEESTSWVDVGHTTTFLE